MNNTFFFQRYSQKENWNTNNTLMFLSLINQEAPFKFQSILNGLIDNTNLNIGTSFIQQTASPTKASVPDGMIIQQGFKIYIETKTDSAFYEDQLLNHISGLDKESSNLKILLTISIDPIPEELKKNVLLKTKKNGINVSIATTTFKEIIGEVSRSINEYETKLYSLLEDYISYCSEEGLINRKEATLLAVTATQSFEENLKYNLYYDPAMRNHNIPFCYIGLYLDKKIKAIGKVTKTIVCDLVNNQLVSPNGENLHLTETEYKRVKDVIENTDYYNLNYGSKYFLVDKFIKIDYIKNSNGPVRQKRYIFLDEIQGFNLNMSTTQIAELLDGRLWE